MRSGMWLTFLVTLGSLALPAAAQTAGLSRSTAKSAVKRAASAKGIHGARVSCDRRVKRRRIRCSISYSKRTGQRCAATASVRRKHRKLRVVAWRSGCGSIPAPPRSSKPPAPPATPAPGEGTPLAAYYNDIIGSSGPLADEGGGQPVQFLDGTLGRFWAYCVEGGGLDYYPLDGGNFTRQVRMETTFALPALKRNGIEFMTYNVATGQWFPEPIRYYEEQTDTSLEYFTRQLLPFRGYFFIYARLSHQLPDGRWQSSVWIPARVTQYYTNRVGDQQIGVCLL